MDKQAVPARDVSARPAVDLQALGNFLSSIGSDNQALIFGPDGNPMYHYTDLAGLLGIVDKHDLWLTHSLYSNDEAEMKHGMDVVKEVLAAEQNAAQDEGVRTRLELLSEHLTSALKGAYVCCFCKTDNLLSQWRAYGANGTGVSVEMNVQAFDVITGPDLPVAQFGLLRFWKIFYDRETQLSIVRDAIHYPHAAATPKEWAEKAADAIEFFLPTFKTSDFREEDEFRLIFTPAADCPVKPDFRVGRGMVVPFYSLRKLIEQADQLRGGQADPRLERLPITKVRMGPSPNKGLNAESIRMMLTHSGYSGLVEESRIPYRG